MIKKLNDDFPCKFSKISKLNLSTNFANTQRKIKVANRRVWIVCVLCCRNVGLSLDRLLHADHGVAPAVEEDVGGGGVGGTGHQLLCCRLDDAVVTVKPAGVPCNHIINISSISPGKTMGV